MKQLIDRSITSNVIISSVLFFMSAGSVCVMAETTALEHAPQANVVLYRVEDNSAVNYRLTIDGEHIGKLTRGKAFHLQLTPGSHTVSSSAANQKPFEIHVKAQGENSFRSHINERHQLILEQENMKEGGNSLVAL